MITNYHPFLCGTLELLATVDQLNVFDLVTVEGLCRRLQLWEEFYGTRFKATSEGCQLCVVVRRTWKSSWDAREIRSDRRWCASLVIPGSPSVSPCNAPFSKNVAAPVNKGCSPLLILVASMIPLMELRGVWPGQRWSRVVKLDWQRLAALPTLDLWGSLTRASAGFAWHDDDVLLHWMSVWLGHERPPLSRGRPPLVGWGHTAHSCPA